MYINMYIYYNFLVTKIFSVLYLIFHFVLRFCHLENEWDFRDNVAWRPRP